MLLRLALLITVGLPGCALPLRAVKVVGPQELVAPLERGEQDLASVDYLSGYRGEIPQHLVPGPQPVSVTDRGWIELTPKEEGTEVRVYVRSERLLERHDFQPVLALTGSQPGQYPNELWFLPSHLDQPLRLYMQDLRNPFNALKFTDGSLVLVELRHGAEVERHLFQNRNTGLTWGASAGLLLRVPTLSPLLVAGPTLGWRTRHRPGLNRVLDSVSIVTSVGVGSTALQDVSGDLDQQLSGVFDAALVGGGLELFDVLSLQVFANASSIGRDLHESPWTLGLGFDTIAFAHLTQDLQRKMFASNTLHHTQASQP